MQQPYLPGDLHGNSSVPDGETFTGCLTSHQRVLSGEERVHHGEKTAGVGCCQESEAHAGEILQGQQGPTQARGRRQCQVSEPDHSQTHHVGQDWDHHGHPLHQEVLGHDGRELPQHYKEHEDHREGARGGKRGR